MSYIEVRQPGTGHLLFRYDPARDLVEIKTKGSVTVVDLRGIPPTHLPVVREAATTPSTLAAKGAAGQAGSDNGSAAGKEEGEKVLQPGLIEGGEKDET